MAVTADRPAPYAPAKTILDIMARYRDRGLPSPIDGGTLGRAGVPESLLPRTLQALQTLDLISENGEPTPTFEGIRLAPESEHKKRLEDWLKSTYADIFSFVDPTKDDEVRIRDAFRNYRPNGQQGRMVSLFQGLCVAAGLIAEKSPAARPAAQRLVPRTLTLRPRQNMTPAVRIIPNPMKSAVDSVGRLPSALAGLLENLPKAGESWTSARREKFMTTFGAVLDFCFPIIEAAAKQPDADDKKDSA